MKKLIIGILIVAFLSLGIYLFYLTTIKPGKMRWKYFSIDEFDSKSQNPSVETTYTKNGTLYVKDSAKDNMSYTFVDILDKTREDLEKSWNRDHPDDPIKFSINSGYRTKARNVAVKGATKSAHLTGQAADISTTGWSTEKKEAMLKALYNRGFRRFGIAETYIHVDSKNENGANVVWNYGNDYPLATIDINYIKNLT